MISNQKEMSEMKRREFVKNISLSTLGLVSMGQASRITQTSRDVRDYLKNILYTREEIDAWFNGTAFPFSRYHSQFGWLVNNAQFRDGIDNSVSTYTYAENDGERLMSNYRDKPCRINTYGNSYTQCHQVSDHETWQEVLAAHIQEPVRNFGIGGWSVYQAWLRLQFEEARTPADMIIFNIYEDDHRRNLDSWRNIRVHKHPQHIESTLPYIRVNLKNGKIEERPNPCPTPESFYQMCDLDKTYALFKDDFVLKIMLAHQHAEEKNPDRAYESIMALNRTHGIETKIDSSETLSKAADALHRKAGLFASQKIIEMAEAYALENHKKMIYVLSYPARYIAKYITTGHRWDQKFISFLNHKGLCVVDLGEAHAQDYKNSKLNMEDHLDQYFVGHYNPRGNFFCAYAMKDMVVEKLNPKPIPYR